MKRQWMKHFALYLFIIGISTTTFAQQPESQPTKREKHEIPSPEKNARRITREFKQLFQLTDKEYEKVYELYYAYEKSLMSEQIGRGHRPPRDGMEGPGRRRPGMGGRPNMGGGMPPQGNRPPEMESASPESMKKQMEQRMKEYEQKKEKAAKKLAKKIKKILKDERYTQWQQWETARKAKAQQPPHPEGKTFEQVQQSF